MDDPSSNPTLTDLVKFTYDTVAHTLSSPVVLVSASDIQTAYDICILNGGHKLVAAGVNNPSGVVLGNSPPTPQPLFQATITNISIASSTLTVTTAADSGFSVGQLVGFSGVSPASFLNGAQLQVTTITLSSVSPPQAPQFTALYYYQTLNELHAAAASVPVANISIWESDVKVVYDVSRIPLTRVVGAPLAGQYSVSSGTYAFNAADFGKNVLISYNKFYASAPDTGTATPVFSGQSLVAFELDTSDACVPNSLKVLANSPDRTGNTVSSVSVLSPDGTNAEVYYESHSKLITFADQLFSFYVANRTGVSPGTWAAPTLLTQISGRYTDNRMTVQLDAGGNRYFSQIYYTQLNHPEGLVGNALLGTKPFSGTWLFHVTPGTVAGGSIVQGDLVESVSISPPGSELNFVYLLEPFDALPQQPGLPAAYPFRVGLVNTATMGFTDVPGFYNQQTFTWLRSTKSAMDFASLWAVVGEREVLTTVSESHHLIPAVEPYDFLVGNAATFWQDGGVADNTNNVSYTEVVPPPVNGQYFVEPNGLYTFSASDASVGIRGIDLTGGQLTVTGSNIANMQVGTKVLFSGVTSSAYLNGQIVTVIGTDLARSTFTALFSHADDPEHSDTGLAGKPLTVTYDYVSSIVPVYLSDFNVPPVAEISPSTTVSPPTNITVYRAQPVTFSAAGSYDRDNDPLEYIWSENDPDAVDVALVPSGSDATLTVARAVGGAARTFDVGVAVVDLYPDLITECHPPIPVTNIAIASNTITVTANTNLAAGETVMLYGISISYVNDLAYMVSTPGPTSFTAIPVVGIIADLPSTPVTGWVIPQYQYAISTVSVPFNAAPTIIFPSPPWNVTSPPTYLSVDVPRNSMISITTALNSPPIPNQFPVVITGNNDPDDLTTYQWIQLSGTNVLPGTVQPGQTQIIVTTEDLVFYTNGVNLAGESLVFQLTVNDGVNPPVSNICQANVVGYNYLIGTDTKRLSRSVWTEQDEITNIAVGLVSPSTPNILTVMVDNTFVVGQQVSLSNIVTATFLNGETVTVSTLIGSGPVYTGFTAYFSYPNYGPAADTGLATVAGRVSQRNTVLVWSPLDESILYTDLQTVKRLSVTDGTNRYIVISPYSVLVFGVFGGIPPMTVLLRRLFTPLATAIVDAVHTEDDYTLVLDDKQIFRYSTATLINTDNPDTTIDLANLSSSMQFDSIFSTTSHGNVRILALSGPDGCLLVQVANDTLVVQGTLALTTISNLVAGANNVQFVRLSNVESLSSGKVLVGTVVNVEATVTAVAIASDILTITCNNNFKLGDLIQFSGFTGGTSFLNGALVSVLTRSTTSFTAAFGYPGTLPTTVTATSSLATALNDGKTYETLIDLPYAQIIGTWDASKLRNQFVNTGEILFEPNSAYSGRPVPPVLNAPTASGGKLTLTWTQNRPDLVTGYSIEYAVRPTASFILGVGKQYTAPNFGSDVGVTESVQITQIQISGGTLTVTCNNSYTAGTPVTLNGLANASFLNGQTVTVLPTGLSSTQFTAVSTHGNYGPTSDLGTSTQTLTSTTAISPLVNQYTVDVTGLYTFNVAQVGNTITVSFQSPFTALQQVNSGATQKVTFALASGSYAFKIQALSNDGASGFSNVQIFSF